MQASFGPSLAALVASGMQLPLLAATPVDACTQLARPDRFKNAVVLAQRGNCTFGTKVVSSSCSQGISRVSPFLYPVVASIHSLSSGGFTLSLLCSLVHCAACMYFIFEDLLSH